MKKLFILFALIHSFLLQGCYLVEINNESASNVMLDQRIGNRSIRHVVVRPGLYVIDENLTRFCLSEQIPGQDVKAWLLSTYDVGQRKVQYMITVERDLDEPLTYRYVCVRKVGQELPIQKVRIEWQEIYNCHMTIEEDSSLKIANICPDCSCIKSD